LEALQKESENKREALKKEKAEIEQTIMAANNEKNKQIQKYRKTVYCSKSCNCLKKPKSNH
jgi:hypothetical protein